jgi:hypothetical protein
MTQEWHKQLIMLRLILWQLKRLATPEVTNSEQ